MYRWFQGIGRNSRYILRALTFAISVILLLTILASCVASYRERVIHDPPLADRVGKLAKGKTTEAEVRAWFGVPDLKADGAEITLYSESAMGQYRAKKRIEYTKYNENIARKNWKLQPFDAEVLDKLAKLQVYSSIDDEHIALLYLESDQRTKAVWAPVGGGFGKTNYRQNKLLIFINKRSGVVDHFSYKEEFKTN